MFYLTLTTSSLKQAIESHTPPMGLLTKAVNNGEIFVKSLIVIMIEDVVKFLNVGKTMNENQTVQTAELILSDFNYFRVEDFKLCFNNAKRGYYGKQYDRIDGQVIFEWLHAYAGERADEAERLNNLKKNESIEPVNPEGQKKLTKILADAIVGMQTETRSPKIKKESETEKLIKLYFKEFEELHFKKPVYLKENTSKFINYNGRKVTQIEFIEMKLSGK